MEYRLTVSLDNAAFTEGGAEELARILREEARRVAADGFPTERTLRDTNGNTVGRVEVTT